MKHLLFISFCFVALLSAGQVHETFEEGFPSEALVFPSDRWAISTELPLAGEASFHHIFDNSDAGNDAISWPYNTTLESIPLVWEFLVRYNYNPSSGNHWAFYLASSENAEQMSLEQIADGLVLGVNLSGSDDTLRIWEVADGSYTPWLSTTVNWQDDFEKGAPIALKVALSKESRLSVHINPSGEQGLVEEVGSKELSRRIETQYIGFAYTYTSSADQLLWIDNLYCGPPVADTVAPYLSDWKVVSDSSLQLSFSELMNQESLHRKENYQFLTSTHQITEIFTNGETPTSVTLEVSPKIEENRLYNLQLSSLEDLAGNTIHDTLISFVRTKLHAYDLVFNEFMVDPSPPVGLPEKEFIELHNLLPFPVSLEDMELEINGRYHPLPPVTIDSAGFLIITAQEDTALFSNYGDVLGIPALSALTNTSGCIILRDTARTVLDSVAYYRFWYHNNEKADGGWSLERIDPENICGGSTNWQASTDLIGGTPGQKNACAQPNIDTISPKLVEWYLVSPVQLNIRFSEPVHLGLHTDEGGIRLNGNAPKYLHTDEQAMNYVVILNDTLQSPSNNSLLLERIPDFCNNLLTDTTITISYYAPSFGDVVLSELMSDPDPSQGLPAVEYTELFNASAYPVQLKGFVLTVGSNAAELPTYLLLPGEYLALSRESLQPAHIYNSVAVAGFPTLPNTETTLELWSAQNELLHWVSYRVDWHETESKKEGGWSLEMKNTHLPCKQASNWGSSNDKKGGTPGVPNSIEHNMPDNHAPKLTEVTPTDSLHLWVQFSEPMARKEISTSLFSIANYGGTIEQAAWNDSYHKSLTMTLSEALQYGQTYQLDVSRKITDCEGNAPASSLYTFQLPTRPEKGHCLFNEIHYEPQGSCPEFIELYNSRDKSLDLETLLLGYKKEKTDAWEWIKLITTPGQVKPLQYLVLSADTATLASCYAPCNDAKLLQLDEFPTLRNEGGFLTLQTTNEQTIDEMNYTPELHFSELASTAGVSLERIQWDIPAWDETNWTSASSTANFQTAGCINSQHNSNEGITEVGIHPKAFTPNNDGHEDYTSISLNSPPPEASVTIRIFTSSGHPVYTLANNAFLGTQNSFIWDGKDESSNLLEAGIYIVHIEVFQANKPAKQYRESCTLLR